MDYILKEAQWLRALDTLPVELGLISIIYMVASNSVIPVPEAMMSSSPLSIHQACIDSWAYACRQNTYI